MRNNTSTTQAQRHKRSRRFLLSAASATMLLCLAAHPQERASGRADQTQGNALGRVFYGNFTSPSVRSFESRGDGPLDGMIKEGKLQLTQEDAVRLALENNVDINVERYGPDSSLWGIDKGRAVLNPAVSLSSNLNRLVTPAGSVLQGGETLLNLNTDYNLTIHKPFEPGLDVDVNFATRRARSSSFFQSLNPSFAPTLGVTFTQHLLKDFGGITRGRFLRIARNSLNMSQEEFVVRATDVITNVLNTYWDLVFNEEDINVREASKKLAEVVLEQNRIQEQVGTMAPLDVIQAEAEVAARNEQLVTARHSRRITEDGLKKLISSRLDPGAIPASIVPTSGPAAPPAPASDVSEAIRRALEIRPEVRQSLLDLENKKIDVQYTRNQLKPMLDFVAGYSQNGLGGVRILRDYSQGFFGAPVIGIERGGFFDSLDSLFSSKFLGYSLGFSLQLPIGNDEARATNAQAQISYKQGEERLRAQRQRIALEVREAYDRTAMNRARVESAEVTVRYAGKRLEGEQDKFNMGASTTRFILEAQRDLQDAQSRLLQAKIDLVKSRIALDKAVGDTFSAYNIELKDALRLK